MIFLAYVLLCFMLCFRAASADFDKCEVPMLKASLSFTLKNYTKMNNEYRIDYEQEQKALLGGYGVWKFAVIQNQIYSGHKAIRIIINCVRDCPAEPVAVPSKLYMTVRDEKGLIFKVSFETLVQKKWDDWKNSSMAGFLLDYRVLPKSLFGEKITISFTMFAPKPDRHCMKVDTDEVRKQVANQCFKSIRNNEPLVTLHFRDKNFTIYPSILESHSAFLKDMLDMQRGGEQALVINFSDYSSNIGEMILEILCTGAVHETMLEVRAQHISALMKVYELGHKYQMDFVMQASIEAFKGISPRPTGRETFGFMQLLSILKSEAGDDFLENGLQVEFNPNVVQQSEDKQESKLRQLFNKMRI